MRAGERACCQIKDTLDSESHTDDQADDDQGHEAGATLDELGLKGLVEGNFLTGTGEQVYNLFGLFNLLSGGSGTLVLSGSNVCSEGHETGYCQKHEKLFHNRFCVVSYKLN